MEHVSLYRKWRPRSFSEVVGQPHVTNTLANALSSGRLVHAYLFCGPRGTGKTSTARILAKAINCVEGPTAVPCNNCEACTSISQGTALDVIEIDAASNRKIDEIRELLEKIPYTPTALRSKVYIVDEVHQLTPEASSALLKTLEEPPGHVVFVLATTEPHKILPTIISRCQRFDFTLVPTRDIAALLTRIASHEGIEINTEAVSMLAEHAHGSVRDAIGVMDQISNLSGEAVTQKQVAELLGEVESEMVFDMLDIIAEKDTPGALALVARVLDSGKDPRRFVESLIAYLRSIFLIQNAAGPREIVEATDEHYDRLEERSRRFRRYEVVRLIERLGETHREMRWSDSARMGLECSLVKITSLDADVSLEGILFRLEEMERKLEAFAPEGARAARAPGTVRAAAQEKRGAPKEGAGPSRGQAGTGPGPDAVPWVSEGQPEGRKAAESKKDTGTPAAADGPAFQGREDKERMRWTWLAVLGELKNQGQMRLYALLTRAKIMGVRGGEVTLGFPEEATFQMEILGEPGQLEKVEEAWTRLLDEPVKLALTTFEDKPRKYVPGQVVAPVGPPGKVAKPVTPPPAGKDGRAPAKGAKPDGTKAGGGVPGKKAPADGSEAGRAAVDGGAGESETGEGGAPAGSNSARELAERIKESFDGEILDSPRDAPGVPSGPGPGPEESKSLKQDGGDKG